jgi:hypothetical protein
VGCAWVKGASQGVHAALRCTSSRPCLGREMPNLEDFARRAPGMFGSAGVPTRPAGYYIGDGSRADSGIPPAASR